jgi:hypothetical protein
MARKTAQGVTTPGSTVAKPFMAGSGSSSGGSRGGSGSMPSNPPLPRTGSGLPPGPGKRPR